MKRRKKREEGSDPFFFLPLDSPPFARPKRNPETLNHQPNPELTEREMLDVELPSKQRRRPASGQAALISGLRRGVQCVGGKTAQISSSTTDPLLSAVAGIHAGNLTAVEVLRRPEEEESSGGSIQPRPETLTRPKSVNPLMGPLAWNRGG